MKSILVVLFALTTLVGNVTTTSATSLATNYGAYATILRSGEYYIDFGEPEFANVSRQYAYSIFEILRAILAGTSWGPSTDKQLPEHNETLKMFSTIERVRNTVRLSVSIVHPLTREVYLTSTQETSFFTPDRLIRGLADDVSAKFKMNIELPAQYVRTLYIAKSAEGIRLGPVDYGIALFGPNYDDVLYDIKATPDIPNEFVRSFEDFQSRRTVEGILWLGGLAGAAFSVGYIAFSGGSEPFPTGAPLGIVLGLGIATLGELCVFTDLPSKLMDDLNAWWQEHTE